MQGFLLVCIFTKRSIEIEVYMYFKERLLFWGDYFPYLSRKILRGISLTEEPITPEHSYSSFSVASALADSAEYMTS